jgi:hypothetical protein
MGGFFQCFAGATVGGRLARVQMSRRVVEFQALGGVLLDQQKTALAFDDGGHGDTGFPTKIHIHALERVRKLWMGLKPL